MNRKISVSFSGGRSSGAMCWLVLNDPRYASFEKEFIFANTGQETEATLDFVDACDKAFGLNLVWLEAVVSPALGEGTEFKVVCYETACRDHSIFESGCQKYGLPNPTFKWCTRELKSVILDKYRASIGGDALIAIGIRNDEQDRIKDDPRFCYPLDELGWDKAAVNYFWQQQTFDLRIPSDAYGNCVWCYKKSFRKLATVYDSNPECFAPPTYFEALYSLSGAMQALHGRRFSFSEVVPSFLVFLVFAFGARTDICAKWLLFLSACARQIYRKNKNTAYIKDVAGSFGFRRYADPPSQITLMFLLEMDELDLGGACDQGCEVYLGEVA